MYPAKLESVIAISAIDRNNIAISWSADGSEVELAAPGVGIYSTWLDRGYHSMSGTSMAAPFVSGVAALMMQDNVGASPDEVGLQWLMVRLIWVCKGEIMYMDLGWCRR